MRRFGTTAAARRVAPVIAVALIVLVLSGVSACKSKDTAKTEKRGAIEATGTVQAQLPPESSVSTESSGAVSATATSAVSTTGTSGASKPATRSASAPSKTTQKPAAPTIWPAKVGKYARAVRSPVWYPKSVPAGFKVNSLDVVEFDKGSGLVCDMVFLKGDKALLFTQGSPKNRSYAIVSQGKVPWGPETADIVRQDPADPASPVMIVYSRGGNFAELQGDASLAELKAIAKSMVPVK